jgi:hypothetical protein
MTDVFCACNVRISDISSKLGATQAGSVFHPQGPTEYPRHFQSFCTIVNGQQWRSQVNKFILAYLTRTSLLFDWVN